MSNTKSLKGTKTAENLATAYFAESTAYTRYTYYAQQAVKDKYIQFGHIFDETADNELHHAKIFLKFLTDGGVSASGMGVDTGNLSDTVTNLKIAIKEEQKEGVELYRNAAKTAREEGFPDIADQFDAIADVEAHHKARFERMLKRIEDGTVWKRNEPIEWKCDVCGYIFTGTEPPEVCPACLHPFQHYLAPDYWA